MNILADLSRRIAQLEAKVSNILQEAKVIKIHEDDNLLDIEVRGVKLERVPYLTWRAGANGKTYWVPEVGESGVLLCPDGQVGNAIFLPALNTKKNPAPDTDPNIFHRIFEPGVFESYDRNEDEYELNILNDPIYIMNLDKIEHKLENSTRKIESDKIEDKVSNGISTLESDKYEVQITSGGINLKVGTNAKIEIRDGSIKLTVGTNSVLLNATKVEMRTLSTWIVLTAALANVNGATFTAGATNMLNPAGPVTYPPVRA